MAYNNSAGTVSIGISAFNEQDNIGKLIQSIYAQKGDYILEKIFVISDGSQDATVNIVKHISILHPQILLINTRERKGKCQRLNQLYQMNTSDYLITIDADVLPIGANVIQNLIVFFQDPNVVLVAGKNTPVNSTSLLECVISKSHVMWQNITHQYNDGNNYNNIHGSLVALRKDFAKTICFPIDVFNDGGYLYLSSILAHKKFIYAQNASVRFRVAGSFNDYVSQSERAMLAQDNLYRYFGDLVNKECKIPWKIKMIGLFSTLMNDPIYTCLVIIINITIRFIPYKIRRANMSGKWERAGSTKSLVM